MAGAYVQSVLYYTLYILSILAFSTMFSILLITMRQCERCQKSSIGGGTRKLLRGHYNPTNWTKKRANLQWTRLHTVGKPAGQKVTRRSMVCANCLRTLSRTK